MKRRWVEQERAAGVWEDSAEAGRVTTWYGGRSFVSMINGSVSTQILLSKFLWPVESRGPCGNERCCTKWGLILSIVEDGINRRERDADQGE